MKHSTKEIAESFVNGNISWTRGVLSGSRRKTAAVTAWLKVYSPSNLESFLRLMSN
jgi:hypothetical protein